MAFVAAVLDEWLADDRVTIACGSWADGGIAELLPRGKARLLPVAYEGCFAGVRELRIDGAEHHVHLDLGRVHCLVYCIAPSVCFGGRPSFELRFLTTGAGGARSSRWAVSVMLSHPYPGGTLDPTQVRWFLERARRHIAARPDLVRLELSPDVADAADVRHCIAETLGLPGATRWPDTLGALDGGAQAAGGPDHEPRVLDLLREALRFREASLVIYRERTLVELQTEKLAGVFKYVEDGHVSWQIGEFEDHHCHLALGAVTGVVFSAEPVPCQGGRLNYTVWFLVPGPCGNPYRRDGYFSVVLNRPYANGTPRHEVIEQVFRLYRRHAVHPWVTADDQFLRALESGPTAGGAGSCRG